MGLCAYGAAKAAAIGFIRNLSGEVGPHGVTANAVSLGTMNNWEGSEKIAKKGTSVERAGSPQDVGAAASYLASTEAEWVNGQVLPVNGGGLVARVQRPALQPCGGSSREGFGSFMRQKNCRAGERQSQATAILAAPTALPLWAANHVPASSVPTGSSHSLPLVRIR